MLAEKKSEAGAMAGPGVHFAGERLETSEFATQAQCLAVRFGITNRHAALVLRLLRGRFGDER